VLLTPRYDGDPLIAIEGPADDAQEPLLRQRRRMEEALGQLTDAQWRQPSRCEGWDIQDVINHLIGTNDFWRASMQAGLAGSPTRILAAFDPAATPPLMVEPMRAMTPAETLGRFIDSNRAIANVVEPLDDLGWSVLAEAPPGHLPIRLLAHHALWDAWVHERDILLPLGVAPVEDPDEIRACLCYAAALGPAFAITIDPDRRGALVVEASDPHAHVVIEVGASVAVHGGAAPAGAAQLTGRAVDLVEALSVRAPLTHALSPSDLWLVGGLAAVFDAAVS
jgi:uncharacterized protein (TIGR03083 family)